MIWATNRSIRVRNHGHGIDTTSAVRFAFPRKRAAFFTGMDRKAEPPGRASPLTWQKADDSVRR